MAPNAKLIQEWKDENYGSDNYVYKYENGPYLVFIHNPGTIDFDLTVIFKAGSYFEGQLGATRGTAHMLEHLMAAPHGKFPTIAAQHKFTFGNQDRPSLGTNAYTGDENIGFEASTSQQGWKRAIEYIMNDLDFATNDLSVNINSERNIILAELAHKQPEIKNPGLLWNRMVTNDKYPYYFEDRIGSIENVKSITEEDLQNYYHHTFDAERAAILVQTQMPVDVVMAELAPLVEQICQMRADLQTEVESMVVDQQYIHFHYDSPSIKENYFEIAYTKERNKDIDYNYASRHYFAKAALRYCGKMSLREKKNLVYSFDLGQHFLTPNTEYISLGCKMESVNLLPVMDGLYDLIFSEADQFLDGDDCNDWWQSVLSSYIFKHTAEFDYKFGRGYVYSIFAGEEYGWDEQKGIDAARRLTVADVKEHIHMLFDRAPIVYSSSGIEGDPANMEAYKQSKWTERFGTPKLFLPKDLVKNGNAT